MIFYIVGYRRCMAGINPVNPYYQNNRNWAIANKVKGRNATACAVSSTVIGCAKTFTEKGSSTNWILDIGQKILDALRNLEQYLLYKRKDDDLDFDERQRPIAGNVGQLACNYETKVNPVALPLSAIIGGKFGEAYSTISNWFNSMWWRIRPACQKINWDKLSRIPLKIRKLFDKNIKQRQKTREFLKDNLSPFFGLMGCFCMGIFLPIKAWNKLKENENKWIDAVADGGMLSQHAYYFVGFTLDELFKAQAIGNKNSWYLAGVGAAANIMNIALPLVDVLPLGDRTKALWKELAQGLGRLFFSSRRCINGNAWLEKNKS